jgi:hypothetical protein
LNKVYFEFINLVLHNIFGCYSSFKIKIFNLSALSHLKMNSVDYSKADISRAKTTDYYPGQSTSGPFYNPNSAYSKNLGQSLPNSQVYSGDASRYYAGSRHPAQSYEQ